jgi:FkbM family methyltransferase
MAYPRAIFLAIAIRKDDWMAGRLKVLKRYQRIFGIRGPIGIAQGKLRGRPVLLQVKEFGLKSPIHLRVPSSDVEVFRQIFINNEYKIEVNRDPEFIVDAGANIGIASVYFANQFPNARILAIEPEKENFEVLVKNVKAYPNVQPVLGALWGESAEVEVVDRGLGNWGFMIETSSDRQTASKSSHQKVEGMTVDMILDRYDVQKISILKLDIEGAELEVFRNSSSWIDRIDSLIIELHERMKPGCNRSFYSATSGFDIEWSQGEFVYLTRDGGCLRNTENGRRIGADAVVAHS